MLWKSQSLFSIGQWLRVLETKIRCMHLSFLFAYKHAKRKFLTGIQIQFFDTCNRVRCMKRSWTLQNHKEKKESTRVAPLTNTAQLLHSCWQMGSVTFATRSQSACHAKWMGIQLAEPKSISRRGSSLLTTAWCKRLEMMLLKRWIKQIWTGNKWNKEGETDEWTKKLKRFRKVSRRVPTAISLFFVNDVYNKKRKKRNTRQTQTKKQLEWYLPNNVVCLP